MRLLLIIFLAFSLTACINDDEFQFEPELTMRCNVEKENISLQEVQLQYAHYKATTTQVNQKVMHEIISPIDNHSSLTEYFEFQIDTQTGCVALAKHRITLYGKNATGKTETSIKQLPIDEFYVTEFEKQQTGELAGKYFLVGENEDRQFFLIF